MSADQRLGEMQGERLGLALGQIDQDVGDVARLVRQVDAGDHVGAVLVFGEPAGLGVGGGLRQRVDRGALRLAFALLDRVGVDRDEQRRLPDARHADPVDQRDEAVVGARHHHAIFAGPFELVAQLQL